MTEHLIDNVIDASHAAASRDRRDPTTRGEWHRRRTLRALALFAALAVLCAGCDWRMLGYGPEHMGFNPTESAISVGNVARLVKRFPANNAQGCGARPDLGQMCSSPAVAKGSVYVGAGSDLVASDPVSGSLRWSGHTGGPIWSSPAVVDGVVYVGSDDFKLYAFDAAGSTNCSGSPKICAPLWTALTGGNVRSSPTVANGVVYVGSDDHKLYALSAPGTTNCSGSPKVCTALWTTTAVSGSGRTPAIASGVVYVSGDQLYAFDAAGTASCSGSPKVCTPLWTGTLGPGTMETSPAVANGVVYVGADYVGVGGSFVEAFSAAGTTNCSGSPKVCNAFWGGWVSAHALTTPAIANGVVYVGVPTSASGDSLLSAFDAAGVTNCVQVPGTPDWKTCYPLWTDRRALWAAWSPVVANGVVYVAYQALDNFARSVTVAAYDATGTTNCSGTPKTCSALWSDVVIDFAWVVQDPQASSPVVANGAVYLNAGAIYKYALPS